MAGKWPQETGHRHGAGLVSLKKRENLYLRGAIKVKKHQLALVLDQKNGKGRERADNTEPVSGKPMSALYYDVDLEVTRDVRNR